MTLTKLLTPFMVLALCFGLSACSDQGGDEAASDQTSETSDQAENAGNPSPLNQTESENVEISLVPIAPGGQKPIDQQSAAAKAAEGNPEAIEIGRQLFASFNCNGCHFKGGGGMGPPLMDNKWIYGSSMENIASSIREGRPHGMPTFRTIVQGDTVYKLAAYVKSLSQNTKPKSEVKLAEPAQISEDSAAMDHKGEIISPRESK